LPVLAACFAFFVAFFFFRDGIILPSLIVNLKLKRFFNKTERMNSGGILTPSQAEMSPAIPSLFFGAIVA